MGSDLAAGDVQRIVRKHAGRVGRPFNRCRPVSRALADELVQNGHPACVIRVSHLQRHAPLADARWLELGSQLYWVHYAVQVGEVVYDLTRRQFFPESTLPFVQSRKELEADWEEVGIDMEWRRPGGEAASAAADEAEVAPRLSP